MWIFRIGELTKGVFEEVGPFANVTEAEHEKSEMMRKGVSCLAVREVSPKHLRKIIRNSVVGIKRIIREKKVLQDQLAAEVGMVLRKKLQEYRRSYGPAAKVLLDANLNQWMLNILEAMEKTIPYLKQGYQQKSEKE